MTWDEAEAMRIANEEDIAKEKGWKYFLPEAAQTQEVRHQLDKIQLMNEYKNVQDIKIIDPCMGSGHILVYAFDVLMQIYEDQGWSQRDAAQSILEHNLYGLDIDDRAAQLAYFAVMMKARQYDRRFFTRGIQPNLYHPGAYAEGQEFGSLLMVDELESKPEQPDEITLFDGDYADKLNTWNFRSLLARQYDVVVTNPPYMAVSNGNAALNKFVKDNYPDSKGDLFACFMERCGRFTKQDGYQAMITQHAWMFLSSFEKLRAKLLQSADIVNMAHLGPRAFEEIGGEVVQTTSFVLCRAYIRGYKGAYCRLVDPTTQQGKEEMFLAGENRYTAQQSNFSKIPGSPIAYWASVKIFKAYENGELIGDIADVKIGMGTGKNEIFVREWWEIFYSRIDFSLKSVDDLETSTGRYFPYNKGGEFRLWFGNLHEVLWFDAEGRRYMDTMSGHRENGAHDFYCKEGLTWSFISSSKFGIRYLPTGCFFDVAGSTLFSRNDNFFTLGFLASCVCFEILKILNPTLNYQAGNIKNLPLLIDRKQEVNNRVNQNIQISKQDWDSYETSWDFKRHPLV